MKLSGLLILLTILTPRHIITTIAVRDTGAYIYGADVVNATSLPRAIQVATDNLGNVYIPDAGNNVVKKVSTDGVTSIVAGNYQRGEKGDGGIALAASFNTPADLAFDKYGNIYIADLRNNRIRKINQLGVIYTIAGTGQPYSTGDGDLAIRATLHYPSAIAFDHDDNLLIVESGGNCIRKINALGIITTIAGNGERGFSGDGENATNAMLNVPTDIAIDSKNNIYITDTKNNRIRKVSPSGIISTFAGTGYSGYDKDGTLAAVCSLNSPFGICIDSKDNIYFSDNGNYLIRKIDTKKIVSTLAGTLGEAGYSGDNESALKCKFSDVCGLALDPFGNLIVADPYNHAIRKITHVTD